MYIWLINHYAVPPKYYPLARQTQFAKYLMQAGHKVTIISASSVHNSNLNLINDKRLWKRELDDGIDHLYIKCMDYEGNGFRRILNMLEFSLKLPFACFVLNKPDAIVSTSMPPVSCAKGLVLAKLYSAIGVAEIADLWPESIISYGIAGPHNPAVIILRALEKWIYKQSDSIIFTMDGGYDYIVDQGWDSDIPSSKVHFINNGIDLHDYYVKESLFKMKDSDLDDGSTFKVIYTGSLRKANSQIMMLLEAAKLMNDNPEYSDYKFFIYGKGELETQIHSYINANHLKNVLVKGYVDKKYIPYILSKCNINILNCVSDDVLKYGGSQNKLFDYLASGHPIITAEANQYSIVKKEQCGVAQKFDSPQSIVDAIVYLRNNPISERHIKNVASKYDYQTLTNDLLKTIQNK